MPFTLLKGTFKPAAGFPDGDSVRFAPNDPSPLFSLPRRGRSPRVNDNNGTLQLRFEGIDAMEKDAKEPFASDATSKNLELIGLTSATDEVDGYILTNQIDPFGRPICFVFSGNAEEEDGSSLFLTAERMKESVNYKLIEAGAAYPLFYDTLFDDLRSELATATKNARTTEVGFWSNDKTNIGVIWAGKDSLPDLDPIFPKLWRRLEGYTQNRSFRDESNTLDAFIDYLETRSERIVVTSEPKTTDFDNIVEVDGAIVKLLVLPEDIVIMS
ncbi:MAG: thermonuclease family protein [Cyanobacteria bacterium P01_F01_bin.143]